VIIVVGNGRPCGQCHKQDKDIANDIAPHRAGVSGWLVERYEPVVFSCPKLTGR